MLQSVLGPLGLHYTPELLEKLLKGTVHIVVILIAGLVTLRLVDSALKRMLSIVPPGSQGRTSRVEKRTETLRHIVGSFGKIVIWGITLLMIIREFDVDTGPLLTGAGILGLAVGFGAQSLVKDVIAGFFILLEDQYGVGDAVRIGDMQGVVEHMTLRITILRNFEGHVHLIPNGTVTSLTVTTRDWARAIVDITVPHTVEIGRLFSVLESAATRLAGEMKGLIIDKPEILGIEKLSEEGATVRMAVKTPPSQQAKVSREWRLLIREVLDREGIELSQKKGT
jgi:moderate conductance mechanosensitive channel